MAHDSVFSPDEVQVEWNDVPNRTKEEQLYKLAEHHFTSTSTNITASTNNIEPFPNTSLQGEVLPSEQEIKAALLSINQKKAPGPDSIDARTLRRVHESCPKLINCWVRKCMELAHFPHCLKTGEVIFFLKKNKPPADPSSYRPICLLPSLGKLLEKILVGRLTHHLEQNGLLHQAQFGFRERLSTEHAILHAIRQLKEGEHKYKALISLDIKGAFDNLPWRCIKDQLKKLNCPARTTNTIFSYLESRRIAVHWGAGSRELAVNKGCPQGSCLGPVLWNIVANTLLITLTSQGKKLTAFADDFLLQAEGDTRKLLERDANESLVTVQEWLEAHSLEVSISKCVATTFSNLKRPPTFKLKGENVPNRPHFTYLGIVIDRRLNWRPHINSLKLKALKITTCLRKLAPTTWGIQAELLKIWYLAVAERTLCYGAGAWGDDLTQTSRKMLDTVQRPLLLTILRAYRTTSTATLCTLAGIPPLSIVVARDSKRTKLLQLRQEITIGAIPYSPSTVDTHLPKWGLHPSSTPRGLRLLDEDAVVPLCTKIYTDGSKTEDGTAAAFVAFQLPPRAIHEEPIKLRHENSVFQAEAWAILSAIKWVKAADIKKAIIYTDSLSTLMALQQHRPCHTIIRKIHEHLLHPIPTIYLKWVKAHAGIIGNERADALAKEATKDPGITIDLPLPMSHVKAALKIDLLDRWQDEWSTGYTGRRTAHFLPSVSVTRLVSFRPLVLYLSGHGPFHSYLNRFKLKGHPNCECGEIGSPDHLLFDCVLTQRFRIRPPPTGHCEIWLAQIHRTSALRRKLRDWQSYLMELRQLT